MRIGVLTSVHPAMDTRIYFKQARSLVRAGHEVYLVARDGGNPTDVHYERLPIPRSRVHRIWTVVQLLRRALQLRCEAYHIHDPELLPVAVLLKWLTGAQVIFDKHENVCEQIRNKYWIPKPLRGVVAGLYVVTERICLRWIDHIVLAEDSYAGDYASDATTIIRNYPMLPSRELSRHPRSYSRLPKLAYCGVVAEIRGALEMIETAARLRERLPKVELHIIGPCFPATFEDELRARIDKLSVRDHVTLYGRMPLDRAMQIVARCDIGLAPLHPDPNYLESLPTKMFEYMALALPVVVSDFPLWKSIVDDADCGLGVDALDPNAIARAVGHIFEDPELMETLGNNGRKAVLEKYSWEAEEAKLLALYAPGEHRPDATRAGAPGVGALEASAKSTEEASDTKTREARV